MSVTCEPSSVDLDIHHYLRNEGKDKIMEILKDKVDMNSPNEDGDTMLHSILMNKTMTETDIVRILFSFLTGGANPNIKNKNDLAPIHVAILKRMRYAADILLLYNTDMHILTGSNDTLIEFFMKDEVEKWKKIRYDSSGIIITAKNRQKIMNDSVSFIEFLISEYGNFDAQNDLIEAAITYYLPYFLPTLLEHRNNFEFVRIHSRELLERFLKRCLSIRTDLLVNGNLYPGYAAKTVQILLDRCTPITVDDNYIIKPIAMAIKNKVEMSVIEVMVNHLLCNCYDGKFATSMFDELTRTCIWWDNNYETDYFLTVLSDLIVQGADVDQENQSQKRPVHIALIDAKTSCLLEFLNENTAVDFSVKTETGQSLLHLLAEKKDSLIQDRDFHSEVWYLTSCCSGIEINAITSTRGKSALHTAVYWDNAPMVLALIDNGADVNCKDLCSQTPLHEALITSTNKQSEQNELVVNILLSNGADPNAVDSNGYSPLHYAVRTCQVTATRLLIEHGADVNIRNEIARMETPLHCVAKKPEAAEIIELLFINGADVNAEDSFGNTPIRRIDAIISNLGSRSLTSRLRRFAHQLSKLLSHANAYASRHTGRPNR